MLLSYRVVKIVIEDICIICMVLIMARVNYAYYSSFQGQPLASLRCQVTVSMVFSPSSHCWAAKLLCLLPAWVVSWDPES